MQSYTITTGQQRTQEWHRQREGSITGSIAKKVKSTGNAYLYENLAVMTTEREPKDLKGIKHVDRGVDLEPEAIAKYEKATKQKVEQVAFIQNNTYRYGISPDALVMKPKGAGVKKLVEIKCPDTNNHIRYILEGRVPDEHEDQIIHGFIVCPDVNEIDFVSYCPEFHHNPLLIINVKRDKYQTDISLAKIKYDKYLTKRDEAYKKLIL